MKWWEGKGIGAWGKWSCEFGRRWNFHVSKAECLYYDLFIEIENKLNIIVAIAVVCNLAPN